MLRSAATRSNQVKYEAISSPSRYTGNLGRSAYSTPGMAVVAVPPAAWSLSRSRERTCCLSRFRSRCSLSRSRCFLSHCSSHKLSFSRSSPSLLPSLSSLVSRVHGRVVGEPTQGTRRILFLHLHILTLPSLISSCVDDIVDNRRTLQKLKKQANTKPKRNT